MAKYDSSFVTDLPIQRGKDICQYLKANGNWDVIEINERHFTLKEKKGVFRTLTSNTYPVQLDLVIEAENRGTRFLVSGSNFGIGPFQSKGVKDKVNEFITETQELIREVKKVWVEVEREVQIDIQAKIDAGIMCPTCKQEIAPGTKFCPRDGTPIGRKCNQCGTTNSPSAQFCTNCGSALGD